jgi:hypothetical protein
MVVMIKKQGFTMPNIAYIPGKDSSYSAVRLSQLEGLGYGPDLQDENLALNQDSEGRIDLRSPQPKRGQKRQKRSGS